MTERDHNRESVTLRSPETGEEVRVNDPDEIREYEHNGYQRVTNPDQQ